MKHSILLLLCITTCTLHAAEMTKAIPATKEQEKMRALNNAMWNAVASEKIKILKKLFSVKPHPDVNDLAVDGQTPLFVVAWNGNAEIGEFLIAHDAKLNIQKMVVKRHLCWQLYSARNPWYNNLLLLMLTLL